MIMNAKQKRLKKAIPLYIMVAPGFLYLLINNYIPMAGMIIAFKDLNFAKGIFKSDWAGLSNFEFLFKTPDAFLITRNTLLYNLAFIVVNTVVAIFIAIMLSEIRGKKKIRLFQSCVLIPSLISIIIVSYLGYAFLSGESGFINSIFTALGLEKISFYTESKYWPAILVFINCWKGAGYSSVIYLAAILGIDQEMFEAAEIDGANRWNKIRFITIPLLKTTVITMTLLSIGRIFYSDFGLFYQVPMNSGALINATNTIDTYVYRGLIELGDISMSSAACVYQSLVGFIVVMLANHITKKISRENALF